MRKYVRYIVMGTIAAVLSALLLKPSKVQDPAPRSYEEIIRSGVLRAVTEYNSISFHASGDSIEGFHYELLQAFAKDKGLEVEFTPRMSFEERIQGIHRGDYDVLANHVMVTTELKDTLLFTSPIVQNRLVLVQRKAQGEEDSCYIKSALELANKTLHVTKGSPAILRIHNLSNEIGDTIYVKEIEKYGQEHLLALVASGDIDYAVCNENIAKASIESMPELDIQTVISFNQFYSWGVNKKNTALRDTLDQWLDSFKQTKAFKQIMKKYYKN